MDISKDILTLISASSMISDRTNALDRLEKLSQDGHVGASLYLGYHNAMRDEDNAVYMERVKEIDLQEMGRKDGLISYLIGLAYGAGFIYEENVADMAEWLKKAGEQGCPLGDFELGYYYFHLAAEGAEEQAETELEKAIACFNRSSKAGLVEGDLALGELYMDLEKDAKAEPFFKKAADAGSSDGVLGLGLIALGAERFKEAKKLLKQAMEQGNAAAAFHLGSVFISIDNDQKRGIEYFEKSADAGYLDASFELGLLYYEGEVLTQDYPRAIELFKLAAIEDHPDAQFYLGSMYLEGLGTEKNSEEAVIWLSKAAESGDEDAADILEMIDVDSDE